MSSNFGNWQTEICQIWTSLNADTKQEFQNLTTLADRIDFIRDKKFINDISWIKLYFESCSGYHRKSKEKSFEYRQKGNKHFQKKNYLIAVDEYTQAIMCAPFPDTELALAYANRSAALIHLKKYKECLMDIEHALECGYPEETLYKLYTRKGQALYHMDKLQTAETVLNEAKEQIKNVACLDPKKKEQLLKDITGTLCKIDETRKMGKVDTFFNDRTDCEKNYEIPRVSFGENSIITQATSAVKMEYTEEQGRYIMATEDISAGNTLFVEKPFAAVLLPDNCRSHCHHCYGQLVTCVPCKSCSMVLYCSCECRDDSWSIYHNTECHYLDLLYSVGIAHLSLRIILTAGLDYLIDFRESLKSRPCETDKKLGGIMSEGRYENNYLAVYDLLTHADKLPTEDLFQYTLTAVLLLYILQHSGWFLKSMKNSEKDSDDRSLSQKLEFMDICSRKSTDKEELYIGELLLRHILQLVCNAHAITELQITEVDDHSLVDSKSQVRIATAIYPTASLMNHSCDPNIISSFLKNILVVKAVKDIPKGSEVFNCYGPHCKRMSRQERQQVLHDQYCFVCSCTACQQPDHDNFNFFRCDKCSKTAVIIEDQLVCSHCSNKMDVADYRCKEMESKQLFVKGLQCLQQNDIKGAVDNLKKSYKNRKLILYKYHKDLAETQDCLARCYAILGNFKKSICYLRESIQTVDATYGSKSIELGNELQKFAEVLCNGNEMDEALLVTEKALAIFELQYPEGHDSINELRELKRNLILIKNGM